MVEQEDQIETVVFPPEVVDAVRSAIKRARQDMEEWREKTRMTPERMQQKVHPWRNGKRID